MDIKDNKSKITFVGIVLLLAVLASFLASVITNVAIENWFESYSDSLQSTDSFSILSMTKPEPLPGTYEESLQRAREVGKNSLAYLELKSTDSTRPSDWIVTGDTVAVGVVVTADGWILFDKRTLPRQSTILSGYEVWVSGERLEITSVEFDSLSYFAMIKVSASNLAAVDFGASNEMRSGSIIFALGASDDVFETSIVDSDFKIGNIVAKAELFTTSWQLKEGAQAGWPLFNSSGMFVGFAGDNNLATLLHHGSRSIFAIIKGQSEYSPGFGAYVVDVDSVLNIDSSLVYGYNYGALIYSPDSYSAAIVEGGPAQLAGLKAGDLILSIDGKTIGGSVSMADLLVEHSPGDTIRVQIVNESGTQDKEVVLSNYQELNY